MVERRKIRDRLVIIEYVKYKTSLIQEKSEFIKNTYSNKEATDLLLKIKEGRINFFVGIKLVVDSRIKFKQVEFYSSNSFEELIEVLVLVYEGKQEYEVCEALMTLLK